MDSCVKIRFELIQFMKMLMTGYNVLHTDKPILNLVISNQIWIVFTLFRLIWCQTNQRSVITIQIWFDLTRCVLFPTKLCSVEECFCDPIT